MKLLPGLTWSWRRAITQQPLRRLASRTGIPTSRTGRHAKLGRLILRALSGGR